MIELISWVFTLLSIAGGFLVTSTKSKYRFIAFILWIISNAFWIGFNFYFKHYSPMFLFSVYFIQSAIGIYKNRSLV
jgi:hypothetical protein